MGASHAFFAWCVYEINDFTINESEWNHFYILTLLDIDITVTIKQKAFAQKCTTKELPNMTQIYSIDECKKEFYLATHCLSLLYLCTCDTRVFTRIKCLIATWMWLAVVTNWFVVLSNHLGDTCIHLNFPHHCVVSGNNSNNGCHLDITDGHIIHHCTLVKYRRKSLWVTTVYGWLDHTWLSAATDVVTLPESF